MKKNTVRLGDSTTHGGEVITATSSTIIEGHPAALMGDLVSCPRHGVNKIIEGSKNCFSDGKAIVVHFCLCECGCRVLSSLENAEMES